MLFFNLFVFVNNSAKALLYITWDHSSPGTHCLKRPVSSAWTMHLIHIYGIRPFNANFSSHYDLDWHKIRCRYCRRLIVRHPPVHEPPRQVNMVEDVDCRGDLYTSKEYSYCHTSEEHAATDDVPVQMAISYGENKIREHDVKRAAECFLRIERKASSGPLKTVP